MNKELMKFWVTCPKCKQKFGVEPKVVMKYLERVIDQHKHDLGAIEEILELAQSQIDQEKSAEKED